MTDVELVSQVAAGDHAAFSELMRRHQEMVFAVSFRVMGTREAALDATQETFLTLFRKADRYHAEAAFTTWLYRVALNTCYDLLRKSKRRPVQPLPEYHDPVDPTAGDSFASVELRPSIEAALAAIPEEYRVAVILVDIHGLPLAEVAELLEVPVGTVKSRVFRGRRLLAVSLGNLDRT